MSIGYESGWYTYLCSKNNNKGLLERHEYSIGNLIVSRVNEKGYQFRLFDDFLEFSKYFIKIPDIKRTFFEEILENTPQKFYIDFDATTNEISLEDSLILILNIRNNLRNFIYSLTSQYFPILVFTSSGETKISYHIIVDGICVSNSKQNKYLFNKFYDQLDDKRFIDTTLMKSKQQFRIVGCTKIGKNRYKRLCDLSIDKNGNVWDYPNDIKESKERLIHMFQCSLITATQTCLYLPDFEIPNKKYSISSNLSININDEIVDKCIEMYRKTYEMKQNDILPFYTTNVVQDEDSIAMILCKRISPSYCKVCNRIHEHENPFIVIYGDDYSVIFGCRRNDEKLFLGNIKTKELDLPSSLEYSEINVLESLTNFKLKQIPSTHRKIRILENDIINIYCNSKNIKKSNISIY
jgi:hypothetical protein